MQIKLHLPGKITEENYNELITKINSTGNVYNIEIEAKILDDNSSRRSSAQSLDIRGEDLFFSVYKNEIIKKIDEFGEFDLKTNDIIIVTVENRNYTLGTQLRSIVYRFKGKDPKLIVVSYSAQVF